MTDRLVGIHEVQELTSLSHSSLYSFMRQGLFPKPLRVGPKAVRWLESDLQQWMETRPKAMEAVAAD